MDSEERTIKIIIASVLIVLGLILFFTGASVSVYVNQC